MTTWRERGYVPNSDGEDSAEELETQETLYNYEETTNHAQHNQPVACVIPADVSTTQQPKDEGDSMEIDGSNGAVEEGKLNSTGLEVPELQEDIQPPISTEDADFMDIDEILGVAVTQPQDIPQDIPVLDLSRFQAEEKETNQNNILDAYGPRPTTPERPHRDPTAILESPDPITGEPQTSLWRTPTKPKEPSQDKQIPDDSSMLSSPLSSLPSIGSPASPANRRTSGGIEVVINTNKTTTSAYPALDPSSPAVGNLALDPPQEFHERGYERSLRRRQPIQLHPYALEDARYRSLVKARGIQPVRIRQVQQEVAAAGGEDSQDQEFVPPVERDESQAPRRRTTVISPSKRVDKERVDRERRPEKERRSENYRRDKQDMNDFVDAVHRVEQERLKRRKIAHTYSKKPSAQNHSNGPLRDGDIDMIRGIYDFPESPTTSPRRDILGSRSPNSTLPRRADDKGKEKEKDARRYDNILGPSFSSDTESPPRPSGALRRRAISISSSDGSTPRPRKSDEGARASDNESGSDPEGDKSNASEEDSSQEQNPERSKILKFFKKRGTRGILPASYIRLAEKANNSISAPSVGTTNRHRSQTPPTSERRPGVARAKISSRARHDVHDLFPSDNDSSGSDAEPIITASAPIKPRNRIFTEPRLKQTTLIVSDESDMEDNRIDYGLPSSSRPKTIGTGIRKKRSSTAVSKSADPRTVSSPRRTINTTATSSRPRKQRPRPSTGPRLSVVDATAHLRQSTARSPPRFLKIAARSAAKRKDQGRSSPGRKHFHLDKAGDTQEVLEVLRNWREGTLSFGRSSHGRQDEIPSPQQQLPPPQPIAPAESNTEKKKPPRVAGFRRPGTSSSKPRQTSLIQHSFERNARKSKQQAKKPKAAPKYAIAPPRTGYESYRFNAPRPAQIEREIPLSHSERGVPRLQIPARIHPTARVIENVIANLHQQRARPANPSGITRSVGGPSLVQTHGVLTPPPSSQPPSESGAGAGAGAVPRRQIQRRRKATPTRIDADVIERRQPPAQDLAVIDIDTSPVLGTDTSGLDILLGLLPPGSRYSVNFDTQPLKYGTIFSSETFIGSGGLVVALNTPRPRRLVDRVTVGVFGDMEFRWGGYDEEAASGFEAALEVVAEMAEKEKEKEQENEQEMQNGMERQMFPYKAYQFFGFVCRYLAETVSFHDELDSVSLVQRFLTSVEACSSRLTLRVSGPNDKEGIVKTNTRLILQTSAFLLLVSTQLYQLLAGNPDTREQLEMENIIKRLGKELIGRLLRIGVDRIRSCYEDQRRKASFEKGIGGDHYIVELWVMAIQTLDSTGIKGAGFWEVLNEELHMDKIELSISVKHFEGIWRTMFTLIPLYQFDTAGVGMRINDNHMIKENWQLVKAVTSRALRIYKLNKAAHPSSVVAYIKILYVRCNHLISKWRWGNPDLILPILLDFFYGPGGSMANLSTEQDRGTPDFLLNLDRNPDISIIDSDLCFTLLLKTIALGIQQMTSTSTGSKISNLLYKLIPNHTRRYPKEEPLRVEDLESLKNHHYLLETLYWAAPPDRRLPLEAIKNLVDPETSHREVCFVAVRAWGNLIRWQLSTHEDLQKLKELMSWWGELVEKTVGEHQKARSEAERELREARGKGDFDIQEKDLEANVKINQRKLEDILNDLVKSLSLAMGGIKGNIQQAMVLLTPSVTDHILVNHTKLTPKLLAEVLDLLQCYITACRPSESTAAVVINTDDDSQDYGDWSGFEEVLMLDETKQAAQHFLSTAYDPLFRLLSNSFGSDIQPPEQFLTKIIDTWCVAAGFLVKHGLKDWGVFLEYSRESWSAVRDTEQKRKFTAYFLPKLLEAGADYHASKQAILGAWFQSLVERESRLRFQAGFSEVVLNMDMANPLLENLPFEKDREGKYKVTQTEFRSRRVALISSLLSNMRTHHSSLSPTLAAEVKVTYSHLLRQLMTAMKTNYQLLSRSAGSYVPFCHQIITQLLQHTSTLCPLDSFFTDPSLFPLPDLDPGYIIAHLKKLSLTLSFPGTQKQLNTFIHTLVERSILNHEQPALITQLTTALREGFELGPTTEGHKPTMRSYFLHAVFPAYIEASISHPAGYIICQPLLSALGITIKKLPYAVNPSSLPSSQAALKMLHSVTDSIRRTVSIAMGGNIDITTPRILGVLIMLLKIIAAAIPVLSWLTPDHEDGEEEGMDESTGFLLRFAVYAKGIVSGRRNPEREEEGVRPVDVLAMAGRDGEFEVGRSNAMEGLVRMLGKWCWSERGWGIGDRVAGDLRMGDREEFLRTVEELVETARRGRFRGVVGGRWGRAEERRKRWGGLGLDMVI